MIEKEWLEIDEEFFKSKEENNVIHSGLQLWKYPMQ